MRSRLRIFGKIVFVFAVLAGISSGLWYWLNVSKSMGTYTPSGNGEPILIVSATGGCGRSPIGCPITTYYDNGEITLTHNLDKTVIRHPTMSAAQTVELKRLIAQPASDFHFPAAEKCTAYVDGVDIEYEILSGPTKGTYATCKGKQGGARYNDALLEFYKKVQ